MQLVFLTKNLCLKFYFGVDFSPRRKWFVRNKEFVSLKDKFKSLAIVASMILAFALLILILNVYFYQNNQRKLVETIDTITLNTYATDYANSLDKISFDQKNLIEKTIEDIKDYLDKMQALSSSDKKVTAKIRDSYNVLNKFPSLQNNDDYLLFCKEVVISLRAIQYSKTIDNITELENFKKANIYPIIFTCALSFVFFLVVIYIVWTYTRNINYSLDNLFKIAIEYKKGNYTWNSPIDENNEFTLVQEEFNSMGNQLQSNNNRLLSEIQNKNKLLEIYEKMSKATTEKEVFDILSDSFKNDVNSENTFIYFLDEKSENLNLHYSKEILYASNVEYIRFIPLERATLVTKAFHALRPCYIFNYDLTDLIGKVVSTVAYPIIIESRAIGVIATSSEYRSSYTQEEIDLMGTIAAYSSESILRTRLLASTKNAVSVRDDFISIASHELQTPLTPLKLNLQLIQQKISSDDFKLRKHIESSIKQVDKISHLIDDLLNVTNINTGKIIINKRKFNLAFFINNVINTHIQYRGTNQKIILNNDFEFDIEVNWDQIKIEQILLNLLSNANKYAGDSPVEITVKEKNEQITINVRDFGPGISDENAEIIFKKYERLVNKSSVKGLGLGLYISREIANLHNGQLSLKKSKRGSDFQLSLPIK